MTTIRLSDADLHELKEHLMISAGYLRRMASQDAFHVQMSQAAEARLMDYADNADALRLKIGG